MSDHAIATAQQLLNTSPVAAVITDRNFTPIWYNNSYKIKFDEFSTIGSFLNNQLIMEHGDGELFLFQKIFIPIAVKYKQTGDSFYLTKYPIYDGDRFIVSLVASAQWTDNSSYSEEFFKQAFLMTPNPIVLFSFFSGKIKYLNAAFSKICSMPPEHITNMTLEHLFPEGKDTIAEYLARPEPYTKPFILNATQLDGKAIVLEISPFVFNENGNVMVIFNVQDVTKHMASQLDVISDDSEQYLFLSKSISEATVITEGKKIINVNDKACKLWGYKKNELVGTYLSILFQDGKIDYKSTDPFAPVGFIGIRKGGAVFAGEKISKYFFNTNGSIMVNVLTPLEVSTSWDDNKSDSGGFEKKILDYQPNFIMVYDSFYNLISCNKVMLDFFKCENVSDFKNKYTDISALFLDKRENSITSKSGKNWFILPIENPKNEYKVILKDAGGAMEKIFFLKSVQIIDEEAPYIVSLSDITETVQATLAFKDANSLLVEKSDNAVHELQIKEELLVQQQKLASMGEMLGVITHQWKQPLNAIGILSQHIEVLAGECGGSCSSKAEISDMTASIMEHLNFISETTDNFRDFLKNTDKRLCLSLNNSIISTIKILNIIFKKNDIVIEYNCAEPDSEIRIFGYMNDFRQVIMNVASNSKDAILERRESQKNNFQGKVSITLAKGEVGRVEVRVQDNGAGISEEALEKIFDRDFTTKEDNGSGIGMYISKLIVDKIGGTIKCANRENGAEVIISLPIMRKS